MREPDRLPPCGHRHFFAATSFSTSVSRCSSLIAVPKPRWKLQSPWTGHAALPSSTLRFGRELGPHVSFCSKAQSRRRRTANNLRGALQAVACDL